MERDHLSAQSKHAQPYFNSHAHVERDLNGCCDLFIFHISTHTLTWSVTFNTARQHETTYISTHTLTWSVTGHDKPLKIDTIISTHTLTWSVTAVF